MTAPRVSIVLPSIYDGALRRCLDNIKTSAAGPVEVIVVSPLPKVAIDGLDITWVDDPTATGPIKTQSFGAKFARGEYLMAMADDFVLRPMWDSTLVDDYAARERFAEGKPFLLGARFALVGTVFGYFYANFPFVKCRRFLATMGWYDRIFHRGFGDCDLSLRVWAAGGRCEFSSVEVISPTADDARKGTMVANREDVQRFATRWASRYGRGWEASSLDGFNFNVAPPPRALAARTIVENNRATFMALYPPAPRLVDMVGTDNIVLIGDVYARVPQHLGAVELSTPETLKRNDIRTFATLAQARAE
jgi:hypothetical protein